MKDNLKKYVEENRSDFEVYREDQDQLWEAIEKRRKTKTFQLGTWVWRAAAAVLLIAVAGYLAFVDGPNSKKYADGIDLHELSEELAEAEFYYSEMINEKLRHIQAKSGDFDRLVMEDISKLDSAYEDLKYDLKENINNEKVINAMIENYRIKLEILEQILQELDEKSNEQEFEPVTI